MMFEALPAAASLPCRAGQQQAAGSMCMCACMCGRAPETFSHVTDLSLTQARICSGGAHLIIRISDQGGGIPQENLTKVVILQPLLLITTAVHCMHTVTVPYQLAVACCSLFHQDGLFHDLYVLLSLVLGNITSSDILIAESSQQSSSCFSTLILPLLLLLLAGLVLRLHHQPHRHP
jgi:hypothetical protein